MRWPSGFLVLQLVALLARWVLVAQAQSTNTTTAVADIVGSLTVYSVVVALFSPLIAWYGGLVAGLTVSVVDVVAGWLSLRMYSLAEAQVDRDIWLGLSVLSILMFILSFGIATAKAIGSYARRLKAPRLPDLPV